MSPIRTSITTSWDAAAERTKRHYLRKARQVIHAALEKIAPENSVELLSGVHERSTGEKSGLDSTPSFGSWKGSEVPQRDRQQTRMRASPEQLDHFLAFMKSSRAIQDLSFGDKNSLSSGTEMKISNAIRTSVPEQIVKQCERYCVESGFSSPLSRRSNLGILKVCSASMRKSLKGFDYLSADGGKAFDNLQEVVEKVGDRYQRGMSWPTEISRKLKLAKRYFKGDYKVSC